MVVTEPVGNVESAHGLGEFQPRRAHVTRTYNLSTRTSHRALCDARGLGDVETVDFGELHGHLCHREPPRKGGGTNHLSREANAGGAKGRGARGAVKAPASSPLRSPRAQGLAGRRAATLGGCASRSLPVTPDSISETHFEKDKLGPGGPCLCVLVLGRRRKEKRRRRRRAAGGVGQAPESSSGDWDRSWAAAAPRGLQQGCARPGRCALARASLGGGCWALPGGPVNCGMGSSCRSSHSAAPRAGATPLRLCISVG